MVGERAKWCQYTNKNDMLDCEKCRSIELVEHVLKVLERLVDNMFEDRLNDKFNTQCNGEKRS